MLKDAERFFWVYSQLPIEERKNPIVVIDNQAICWSLAKDHIENGTERGKKILEMLIELNII